MSVPTVDRVKRLEALLLHDPDNRGMLEDAADAAYEARDHEAVARFLKHLEALGQLSPQARNLRAMSQIAVGSYESAAAELDEILASGTSDVGLIYNAALAHAFAGHFDRAAFLLDEQIIRSNPAAATLRVQVLHHLGRLTEALAVANTTDPDARSPSMNAALSVAALDLGDTAAAHAFAAAAPHEPESLTTLGALALDQGRVADAETKFASALRVNERSGRAWIGLGLAELAAQRYLVASEHLDRGATLLKTHSGSWIAAGWAHFINGQFALALERFQTALALDPNFAEAHGAIAVASLALGEVDESRRRTEVALRLDRHCLSAALARSQHLARRGKVEAATQIRHAAIHHSLDERGTTIAAAALRFGMDFRHLQSR